MATVRVRHVTAWAGRTKHQADGFLLDGMYNTTRQTASYPTKWDPMYARVCPFTPVFVIL